MKTDIYQTVTDSIVAMLENGVRPWAPENLRYCTRSENLMDSVGKAQFGFERYPWRLMAVGETFVVGSNYPRKNIAWRSRERGQKFDRQFTVAANDDGSWIVTRVA